MSDSGTWPLPEASGSFLDEDSEDKDIPKAQTLSIQGSYLVLYAQGQGVPGARSWLLQALGGQPWVMGRAQDSGSGVWPRAQVRLFPFGWSDRGLWPWMSSECAGHGHPASLPLPVLLLAPEVPFSLPSSLLGTDCICKPPRGPSPLSRSLAEIPRPRSAAAAPILLTYPPAHPLLAQLLPSVLICTQPCAHHLQGMDKAYFRSYSFSFLSLASVSPSVQCWKG